MKIKEVLLRDPATHPLVNQGQARISEVRDEQTQQELRGELSTFVCEGQYADGIQKILRSFLDNLSKTSQGGAWVSGFFGSGKSHLLKMLSHLWVNTEFPDGATARTIVPSMPADLHALLRELDTAGRRAGGLLAAAGSLPSGSTDNVRLTILGVLLRAAGLPAEYPQARFCLWLHSIGQFETVRVAIEAAGKSFDSELNNLYVSSHIAAAIMAAEKNFASTERDAKQLLKAQFPPQLTDISTDEFLRGAKDALRLAGKDGRTPCTLLVLDEVQLYIGDSNDRAVLVTEVAEAVEKQLSSQVAIVGAGQSALSNIPLLGRLMDRFTIGVPLADADVETVTRKVLLQKKPSAVGDVHNVLDRYAGEISRQLQGTKIGEIAEDRATIIDDYPLLPVRRRLWENCFRQIDAAGTSSQLRSQLRIIHDALVKITERELGAITGGDELFEALAPEMVNTGVLLREINERIIQIGETEGILAKRICGLVFLIGKLRREPGVDIGVRASKEHLADLLIDDLEGDNGKLRSEIEQTLLRLSNQGTLMVVGDEYRLQTREGIEWDREFRNRQTKLNADESSIQFKRDQVLYRRLEKVLQDTRIVQGAAKEPRPFKISREQNLPGFDGSGIPVWIHDGWSTSEKEVVEAARAAGIASPIVFVLISKQSAEDLRRTIVDSEAAEQVAHERGNPTTPEGQEARQSLESRRLRAIGERDRLVAEIISNTKVYQGGGTEVLATELEGRIQTAAETALMRLFPRFKEADSAAWATVIKRARDGADHPFQPTGYTGATEKHPVCQQVLATIGAGKSGTDIRKLLGGAPFGWPRDAVDAALIALHRMQHIAASANGQPIQPGQLDQNKIAKAEFRVVHATLSVSDRLVLRSLFQALGLSCKSGEESVCASAFLTKLIDLARAAGGDAPLPVCPETATIGDLQRLAGNEQLVEIRKHAADWGTKITEWSAVRDLIAQRLPAWTLVERFAMHAKSLPEAQMQLAEVNAIREQRLLLETSDPANAARSALANLLRDALQTRETAYAEAFGIGTATLAENSDWKQLTEANQKKILDAVRLVTPTKPNVGSDQALADFLDSTPLSHISDETEAIPGRVSRAIESAARLLVPEVQMVSLERSTLRDLAEVEAWIDRQKVKLIDAIRNGPILVS